MKEECTSRGRAFAMPLTSPAYPLGPYRFINREYLIITYRTDPAEAARAGAGAARDRREPLVKFEFIRMPDFDRLRRLHRERTGHSRLVPRPQGRLHPLHVPQRPSADRRRARAVGLSQEAREPDAARRRPTPWSARSTTARCAIATGTMGYKHKPADLAAVKASLAEPNFLLKIIPHVDGTPRICELVEYHLEDVDAEGRLDRAGGARLWLRMRWRRWPSCRCSRSSRRLHIVADLTLGLGKVVHDYLRNRARHERKNPIELAE